jgi:TonB-linked SusC/RagA family outer membrane protein
MKKVLLLFAFLGFLSMQVFAQRTVTGTVTSADDGMGLPGVAVMVKGTQVRTITDLNGSFTLTAPAEATTIIFEFMGMETQEVAISDVMNVEMKSSDIALDDVVVTALGVTREKKSLGYAVQDVGGDELNQASQSNALSALSGRIAGIEVRSSTNLGGSSRIVIRGAKSITGENQPLIVVDGVPIDNQNFNSSGAQTGGGGVDYGNMLNDIDPADIANVSVLKGTAAAIYGSRASNGVILITTKKGKKGKSVFSIDVNSGVTFEQMYMIPELQRKYGGGAIITDAQGGLNGFEQVNIGGTNYLVPQYAVDESWGPKYDPNISVLHWDAFDQESYPDDYLKPRPWVAPDNDVITFWDLGVSYNNSIGVTKAGDDYAIRFSYSNTNAKGTMPGSKMTKNNFKLAGDATLNDYITVNSNLNFAQNYAKGRPTLGYADNSVGQKFFQWGQRQLDFDRLSNYKNIDGTQRPWNRYSWDDGHPKYADNPYWTALENYPEDERTRFFGSIGANIKLTNDLKLRGNIYGDIYTFYVRERSAVGSQATSYYYEIVRHNSEFNYEAILDYSKRFDKFGVTGLAGVNRRVIRYDSNSGTTEGGLIVPGIYNLRNSAQDPVLNDFTSEKLVNSVFASASFDYNNLLFFEASLRNDWSSTLPDDHNSYFYPGASVSLLFSELLDMSWFNLGKVRFGWSQVGNDTSPYNVKPTYSYNGNGGFMGTPRLFVDRALVNTDLKPEKTTSIEVGLELSMFLNRVSLNATYFKNNTVDQIIPLELSKATGYNSKWINAGEMQNTGVEIFLSGIPVQTTDFSWNVNVNFTTVKNEVVSLYPGIETLNIATAPFSGVVLRASVGDRYGQLWGYDYIYDDAGNRVVAANGTWRRTPSLVPLGSVFPDYNMGIRNTLKYKGFDLSFLFDIQKGGKFYSLTHMWAMYSGMLEETAGVNDKGNEIRDAVADGGGIRLDGVKGTVTFNTDGTYTVTDVTP